MRTRILRPIAVTFLVAALAATVVGCASRAGSPGTGSPATASPTARPTSCPTPAPGLVRTLTEHDTGSSVCLAIGERLEVYLHGTVAAPWTPVGLDGTALTVAVSGKRTLPIGVTAGFYDAKTIGEARLSASRPGCATPSSTATPCVPNTFTVDIQVR